MSALEVDQGVCGVVIVDADRLIRHWDEGAERLFGYTADEVRGRSLDTIASDGLRARHGSPTGEDIVGGPITCSDGTIRPFDARCLFMKDAHDRQIGAAMIFTGDADPVVAAKPAQRGQFDALTDHSFVSLATRRRNGWIVPTTVWFAVEHDTVYVNTDQRSAKVTRIRNDPRVTLCPCTARGRLLGQAIEGYASIVPTEQRARADALLRAKYRWQRTVFASMHRERMRYSELIAIVPRSHQPL